MASISIPTGRVCFENRTFAVRKFRLGRICQENRTLTVAVNSADLSTTFYKDPQDVIDYSLDWTKVVGATLLTSSSWASSDVAVTFSNQSFAGPVTTAFLTGGVQDASYIITNTIVAAGQTFAQDFVLSVKIR
jgi:hypothetical protein